MPICVPSAAGGWSWENALGLVGIVPSADPGSPAKARQRLVPLNAGWMSSGKEKTTDGSFGEYFALS